MAADLLMFAWNVITIQFLEKTTRHAHWHYKLTHTPSPYMPKFVLRGMIDFFALPLTFLKLSS